MGLFDAPEVQTKTSRSYVLVYVLGLLAVTGGLVAAQHIRVRQVAQAKVAAEQQMERVWIRGVPKGLSEISAKVDDAHKAMAEILVKETKYRKVAGIEIAQPLSKDAQRRYDELNTLTASLVLKYNAIAGAYNRHRAAYKGPWPDGPAPPAFFPLL